MTNYGEVLILTVLFKAPRARVGHKNGKKSKVSQNL